MVKEIKLSNKMISLVDDCDYDFLMKWSWYATRNRNGAVYARCGVYDPATKKQRQTLMHRMLCDGVQVDHIDRDTLNNQRSNLRPAHQSMNQHNKNYPNKNGFKGVNWHAKNKKFQARIQLNGKRINVGYFHTPFEAHIALERFRNGIPFMQPEQES